MAYSDKVLNHYENPRNVGKLDKNDPNVGTGLVGAPACFSGDTLISTPECGSISLKELFDKGEDIFVWSYNLEKKLFEIKKARPVYSGIKKLHKVLIDGEEVWVTPDHKFLTRDREYKENSLISDNESIMPYKIEKDLFIKKNDEEKEKDCYTLQVEENNNYIISIRDYGFVVKNCGDVMQLQIKVNEETQLIEDAKFKTYGCFVSKTKINTPIHSKKMSDLKSGDEVLAWNGEKIVNQKIKEIKKHFVNVDDLLVIEFQRETSRNNINPGTFKLICTKEHIFWNANNTPIEAQDLIPGQELYEITEHELRILTNIRHRDELKQKSSERMFEFNKEYDHSTLPQNSKGYVHTNPEWNKKLSAGLVERWKDTNFRKNWANGMSKIDRSAPTSIEREFIKLFEENNVGIRFSAGKIWIQTEDGPASPDFIIPGKKKCVEVYTKKMPIFMQDRSEGSDYEEKRGKQLATAGYETLFIPIEEIDSALEKINNFIHNGMKVISVSPITHGNELRGCERENIKIPVRKKKRVAVFDLELEEGAHVYFANRVGSHNCGSAIAASSLTTEYLKGRTLDQATEIKNTEIAEELALPPVKIHCSVLAEDSIKSAIKNYKEKQEKQACACST
jgi:NifU-like protein involved in Fe-S cluster formation